MNPILFNLGIIEIRWYSLLILIAFIIGYLIVSKELASKGFKKNNVFDLCFYMFLVSIVGARIYYCLFQWKYYSQNLIDVFKVWEGGLAIHGGIISGIVFLLFYSKRHKLYFLEILDIFSIPLVLGQSIGRWGNFFNTEAYGSVVSLNFLKSLHIPNFIINGMKINGLYHHPTFLYESIGCLVIFIILIIVKKYIRLKNGFVFSIYLILYGLLRFTIEYYRTDSLMLFNIKIAQLISLIMVLTGLLVIIFKIGKKTN